MAIDFGILERTPTIASRFMAGQEAARAEQERNMLLQQRQMQFEQEQENRLLSRQKMQADLATARQRQQSLAAAAKSFQQFGRDLNPQTLEEGIARAIESGDDKALDFLSKVRTEFRQSLVDRQVFGDLLDSAAPTPPAGVPAGAAPAAAMPSAAPVVAPAAAAPSLPSPEEKYLQNVSQALTERGFPPPKGVPIPALRSTTAQTLPVGEFAGVPVAASVPEGFAEAMVPTNYLAPQPAAPANAMLAPPAAPAVQVAGPAALPPAAPKTFEYGGRTYTPQQVNLLLRDERAGRRELGEKIVAANKPTREGMSPLGRLYAEQAALPPGDPRQQVYAAAIEKESERPDKGTQLAQYLRERQAIAQANPADPRLAIYDDVIKKMREKPEGTTVNVQAFEPASIQAQKEFISAASKQRETLVNAPNIIENVNAAKQLIPGASAFMGKGGEPLLAAASFLNNRLGFSINTKGVTDATELNTRLFEGILENLKRLDSQPTQQQQNALREALGSLGTDPAALPRILDRIEDSLRNRVDRYNKDVTSAQQRGVTFPYDPLIELPPRTRPAAIPTAPAAAPAASGAFPTPPQKAIDRLKRGEGTDAQFDEIFGPGAAAKVRGGR